MLQDYNFPSYKEIKAKSYLWYEYILNGHALKDGKNNLYKVRDFVKEHPEYSNTVSIATSIFIAAGAGYGYKKKYPVVTSGLSSGVSGLLFSTAGCAIHYLVGEIKSAASLFLNSITEHYIISLTSFGFLVGVSNGINMGNFGGLVGGVIVGTVGGLVGTTISIGSTIYNNFDKSFETITSQVSSDIANVKNGLSYVWNGMVDFSHSLYEFFIDNYVTFIASLVGGVTGKTIVKTVIGGEATMKATIGGGIVGSIIGGGVAIIYDRQEDITEIIKNVKSNAYKFFIEEHLIESTTAVVTVMGVGLAIEQHKIYVGIMAMLQIGSFVYKNLKPSEEEIKAWLINDDSENRCNVQDCEEGSDNNLAGEIYNNNA